MPYYPISLRSHVKERSLPRAEVLKFLLHHLSWVKYLPDWRRSLRLISNYPLASTIDLKIPWLTYGAIGWLNNYLTPDMKIFEFGSGGSTIYFRQRVSCVISVEHDQNWVDKVNGAIGSNNNPNNRIIVVPPEKMDNVPAGYKYASTTFSQYTGYCFKRYVETISTYPDAHFDLVLVDGRTRVACILDSVQKIRNGGYLILDNSERDHYKAAYDCMKQYPVHEYFGFGPLSDRFWKTTIWQIKR